MSLAVQVDGLSKKYTLRHEPRERYTALRDVIARRTKGAFRRLYSSPRGSRSTAEEFWALKDVSCEINTGETVGIVGRNGAGKSTLLKILSRITEPTSGRARIKGRVASLLEIGTGFHPELTGRENIYLNGAILGMTRGEIRGAFDEIVAFAEVEKFLDTPVKHYSSGMYMRLAFSVAAHVQPEILIVDEVLAVGDAQFQSKCLGKMNAVAGSGRTVLFVSHNLGAITSLCSRAIHLRSGSVVEVGPSEAVVRSYLDEQSKTGSEDLDRIRRKGGGREARFTSAELTAGNGNSIHFGEPLEITLTIQADRDLEGLMIGCTIFNGSGACIGSAMQPDTFAVPAGEPIEISVSIDHVQLAPGPYYTAFGLSRGIHQDLLDAISGYPTFQVLPSSGANGGPTSWHPSWGDTVFSSAQFNVAKLATKSRG